MERTKALPFLTPAQNVQPWARVVHCAQENGATDFSNIYKKLEQNNTGSMFCMYAATQSTALSCVYCWGSPGAKCHVPFV